MTISTMAPGVDLAKEYLAWLQDRLVTLKRGESQVLSTPFLDPFHDGIEIFTEQHNGQWLIHDGGRTLDNLQDLGVQIEKSDRRQEIIQHAIAGCGVQWRAGRLEAYAGADSLAQRVHFLVTAISRLNDLWMSSTPRTSADFFALVKEYLDEHDAHYIANVPIPGKTVDHPMDFVVSLGRGKERLIKLIGSPSLQSAKLISFTWMELREARPDAERVVVVNDVTLPEAWSEDETETSRHLSQQTMGILSAYSSKVLTWSARNEEVFFSGLLAA